MIKNKLKEIRMTEYQMDRKEFALYIGINQKTYYGWENGNTSPSLLTSLEVAKKLNKNVNEIWYID